MTDWMSTEYVFTSRDVCFDAITDKVIETSIECEVDNWYTQEWRFYGVVLPFLEHGFGVKPNIRIDDLPYHVWVRDLERSYIALREESWSVVRALKSTRRFFRNKKIEEIREYLQSRLEVVHNKITSKEKPPATEE
jgi:hypothetical protein